MEPEIHTVLTGAVGLAAMILLSALTPAARLDDSHEKKIRDAAAQSAKAAKAFEAIMQVPPRRFPATWSRRRGPSRCSRRSSRSRSASAAKAAAA